MMKKAGVKLGHTDDKGQQVFVATVNNMVVTVLKENGDWIRVRQQGAEGWLAKEDAVLLKDAIGLFTSRLEKNPNDAFAYAHRGWAYKERGELASAIKDMSEAIRLNPKEAAAYNNRGLAYHDQKEFDQAILDYTEAIRLDPTLAFAHNNRGLAYEGKQEYPKAIENYNEAIRLEPKYAEAFNNRGMAYELQKGYEHATEDYTEAIRLEPNYAEAYNSLAWLLSVCPKDALRNGKKAIEHAKKACELSDWKNNEFLDTLAAAYAEDGRFDEAVKWQKKTLADPEFAKTFGDECRKRLKLYEQHKPYRD
jgi:tetratricopeptide (TPR) repeat protein